MHDALKADWKAAYVVEFVRFGIARGWSEPLACEWAGEIAEDAFFAEGATDPVQQAQKDVPECEWESANAC